MEEAVLNNEANVNDQKEDRKSMAAVKKIIDKDKCKAALKKTIKIVGVVAGAALVIATTVGICETIKKSAINIKNMRTCSGVYGSNGSTNSGWNFDGEASFAERQGKAYRDDYANQHNPNSAAYKARMDNHANQKNPNNWRYQG